MGVSWLRYQVFFVFKIARHQPQFIIFRGKDNHAINISLCPITMKTFCIYLFYLYFCRQNKCYGAEALDKTPR